MIDSSFGENNQRLIATLKKRRISAFDLLPHRDMREKLVDLVLNGTPQTLAGESAPLFNELRQNLIEANVDDTKVVIFGGGTGLSNIIGGDSRQASWPEAPFNGLKHIFPQTRAVVCVTDDGGSTGELLKDLPVFGLGDIRHVLLSSIQVVQLRKKYDLNTSQATVLVKEIAHLFNYRFNNRPESPEALLRQCNTDLKNFPAAISSYIKTSITYLFTDKQCSKTFGRSHCLGNLLILSAIRRAMVTDCFEDERVILNPGSGEVIYDAISYCAQLFGASDDAAMPCTVVPAKLRFRYTDGVQVTGESKSSSAMRGSAVDRVTIDFCGIPYVSDRVIRHILEADVLIMAPGSLYSSIIPVMQVPGIAHAVRKNKRALKLLISNLWVQEGETDKSTSDPERKFHISDLIKAYEHNLPAGVSGLFDQILCLSMLDVPASVIQNYAVEGKNPIYLDRDLIKTWGFAPIECGFFSKSGMLERGVIQHDPEVVARTVKTLYLARELFEPPGINGVADTGVSTDTQIDGSRLVCTPSLNYQKISNWCTAAFINFESGDASIQKKADIRSLLVEILWTHQDIPLRHLELISGITFIHEKKWRRDQRWDNVFSFYDPDDCLIKIREDRLLDRQSFEVAFLIAVGQALLGNYASEKIVKPLSDENSDIGIVYHLHLENIAARRCYLSDRELREFLTLARMVEQSPRHFTRAVNGPEGFTPPGLLMGLLYAWYLDNRFASHIEYKMSIMKVRPTHLIPEQKKMRNRRERLIDFFRESVFGKEIELL